MFCGPWKSKAFSLGPSQSGNGTRSLSERGQSGYMTCVKIERKKVEGCLVGIRFTIEESFRETNLAFKRAISLDSYQALIVLGDREGIGYEFAADGSQWVTNITGIS